MAHITEIIIKPLITEKTSVATDQYNRYGFVVQTWANKNQIRDAVEKLYDVKVLDIKTNVAPGKLRRFGMAVKKTSKVKKAFVRLKDGQKIEFFKGI